MDEVSTKSRIIEVARELCQRLGPRGFSFREIASRLGIKSASVHHHFATKEELLVGLLRSYAQTVAHRQAEIDATTTSPLDAIAAFLLSIEELAAREGCISLCGALAADVEGLPPTVRVALQEFTAANATWLAGHIARGCERGDFTTTAPPQLVARSMLASMQGMLLAARVGEGASSLAPMRAWLLSTLIGQTPATI